MLGNPCLACLKGDRCPQVGAFNLQVFIAWAHDRQAPDCPDFRARTFRGLEGVSDLSRSLLSSREG